MSDKGPRAIDIGHDFMAYLYAHPEQRFWQALCNWSGRAFIIARDNGRLPMGEGECDTYGWRGKGPTE